MSSKILHMNSTNFKIIIFISLLIIYLLVSDNILERFTTTASTTVPITVPITTTNQCPQITLPVPTVVINSDSLFSDIREFIGRPSLINNNISRNLENVSKNFECAQKNYVKRVTKY
jgi:hypothetical protein